MKSTEKIRPAWASGQRVAPWHVHAFTMCLLSMLLACLVKARASYVPDEDHPKWGTAGPAQQLPTAGVHSLMENRIWKRLLLDPSTPYSSGLRIHMARHRRMKPLTLALGVPHSLMTPEDIAEAYKAYRAAREKTDEDAEEAEFQIKGVTMHAYFQDRQTASDITTSNEVRIMPQGLATTSVGLKLKGIMMTQNMSNHGYARRR